MNGLAERLSTTAFVFRGYNVTNLGRSAEMLAHPKFGPLIEPYLKDAGETCAEVTGRPVDLVARIRRGEEADLDHYAEAVALVMAMEMAQLRLLKEFFGVDYSQARLAYGYSLGEIAALVAGGVMAMCDALRVPLSVAKDCAELANDTTLGVLFCAGRPSTPRPSSGSASKSIKPDRGSSAFRPISRRTPCCSAAKGIRSTASPT